MINITPKQIIDNPNPNVERLRILADHLEKGKLGHSVFDFARWNNSPNGGQYDEKGCGTHGCAIGELPILFPKIFEFVNTSNELSPHFAVRFIDDDSFSYKTVDTAIRFFSLTKFEALHLFVEVCGSVWSAICLPINPTKENVATHIRLYCDWVDCGLRNKFMYILGNIVSDLEIDQITENYNNYLEIKGTIFDEDTYQKWLNKLDLPAIEYRNERVRINRLTTA